MKNPYKITCNSKRKKPSVLGRYATMKAALAALEVYEKKNSESRQIEKKYPGQGVQDLFCDLKISGPV